MSERVTSGSEEALNIVTEDAESIDATSDETVGSNRDVLRLPQFRRLLVAWVFGNFGDSLLYITVAIWVKQITGSDSAAGLVFVALGLPALFAPLTGMLADRFNRKYLLAINFAVAAGITLLLLVVQDINQLWLVYVVIFLYANAGYVTAAGQSGLLHSMLRSNMLPAVNGMLGSVDQGLRIFSPLAGAGLLALFGIESVVYVTAACLMTTALILLTLKVKPHEPAKDEDESFFRRVSAGFRFMLSHRRLRWASLTVLITIAATGVLNVTNFASLEQGAGVSSNLLSVLVSVQGIMAVVGGLLASTSIRRFGFSWTMAIAVVITGIGVALMATSSFALFLVGSGLLGFGVPWLVVSYVSLRQTVTPHHLQGRASAASNLVFNIPQIIVSATVAGLVAIVDYRVIIVSAAIACFCACFPLLIGSSNHRESAQR